MPAARSRRPALPPAQSVRRRHPLELLTGAAPEPPSSPPAPVGPAAPAAPAADPARSAAPPGLNGGEHERRSFMLDAETIARIEELRWALRLDKSAVVRRAVELLAQREQSAGRKPA